MQTFQNSELSGIGREPWHYEETKNQELREMLMCVEENAHLKHPTCDVGPPPHSPATPVMTSGTQRVGFRTETPSSETRIPRFLGTKATVLEFWLSSCVSYSSNDSSRFFPAIRQTKAGMIRVFLCSRLPPQRVSDQGLCSTFTHYHRMWALEVGRAPSSSPPDRFHFPVFSAQS